MNNLFNGPAFDKASGYISGLGIVAIWSGFIVLSRVGMVGNLNAYDITALRFMVSAVITLPFLYSYWPRHLAFHKVLFLSACGPGALYSMLMYTGLKTSPAAYAGVFANGTIPIFTALIGFFLMQTRLGFRSLIAIAVIFVGGLAVGFDGLRAGGPDAIQGVVYFLSASILLAIYFVGLQYWKLEPKQALVVVNIPTAVAFLPIWYVFLPSTMATASIEEIALQALFQGIGPSFLAVLMMAYTVQKLGPGVVSGFAASVPSVAAVAAVFVLGETLDLIEWAGMLTVTVGLLMLLWRR